MQSVTWKYSLVAYETNSVLREILGLSYLFI